METALLFCISHFLDQAIAIAERENDQALEFRLLAQASITVLYHDNYADRGKEVIRICDHAIALSESIDDLGPEPMPGYVRGLMYAQSGEPDSAFEMVQLAIQNADQLRDRSLMSRTNFGMSVAPFLLGNWDTAREYTDKGIFYAPHDPRSLFIRSQVEYETGNAVEGDEVLDRSIEIAASAPTGQSFEYAISSAAAAIASFISRDESGLIYAEETARVVLSTDIAMPFNKMFANMALATVAIVKGDTAGSAAMYEDLLPLRNWHPFIVSGDRLLGMTALSMGDISLAEGHFIDAISFTRKAGYRPQEGWSLHDYSGLLIDRDADGDREKVTELQQSHRYRHGTGYAAAAGTSACAAGNPESVNSPIILIDAQSAICNRIGTPFTRLNFLPLREGDDAKTRSHPTPTAPAPTAHARRASSAAPSNPASRRSR